MENLRLDKYLADMQAGTRSQVKEMIRRGRVEVDNIKIMSPSQKISANSRVTIDGKALDYVSVEYYMLNKPAGVLSASRDKKAKTVMDLIDSRRRKDLFPVGRLDKDTEGLLLITDDGELAHQLLSPKRHVDKVYLAKLLHPVKEKDVEAFENGIDIGEKSPTLPAGLKALPDNQAKITIREGKFHQIKRMFESLGNQVLYLKRLSMGEFYLEDTLAPGEFRPLTDKELLYVKKCKNRTV